MMIDKIVLKFEPVVLVGGGELPSMGLERAELFAKTHVAADGGAGALLAAGRMPDAVIGDLDSLDAAHLRALPAAHVHRIEEQDSTDFEKCLLRIETPLVLGLGFLGGRLDHQLAALHALARFAAQRCVLLGADEAVFLCPPALDLPLEAGTPVSLFPLAPVVGDAQGLQWSFEQLAFAPGGRIGTSNIAQGAVRLRMDAPAMLCILPQSAFEIAVRALAAQSGSWSARA